MIEGNPPPVKVEPMKQRNQRSKTNRRENIRTLARIAESLLLQRFTIGAIALIITMSVRTPRSIYERKNAGKPPKSRKLFTLPSPGEGRNSP